MGEIPEVKSSEPSWFRILLYIKHSQSLWSGCLLEDLISVQDNVFVPEEDTIDQKPLSSTKESSQGDDLYHNVHKELEFDFSGENLDVKREVTKDNAPDPVEEIHHQQVGRMLGDTVLIMPMQIFQSLDINLSVLERYLEELNSKYGNIYKEFDKDIEQKDTLIKKIRSDIKHLLDSQETVEKNVGDLQSWKSLVSMWLDILPRGNAALRLKVDKVREDQVLMENKGVIVFVICLIFGLLAL